jgi:MerR family mercuric resistance operon transcriptional regulator
MESTSDGLTIGVFASEAGVNVETIRFYQRKGLVREPNRTFGSIRRYNGTDVARVRFVKAAQRLGFTLEEIGELLKLDDGTHCSEAARLGAVRLADVRARLADLARMEVALAKLVSKCRAHHGHVCCPLIDALR